MDIDKDICIYMFYVALSLADKILHEFAALCAFKHYQCFEYT